jgi:hypothetical protein
MRTDVKRREFWEWRDHTRSEGCAPWCPRDKSYKPLR